MNTWEQKTSTEPPGGLAAEAHRAPLAPPPGYVPAPGFEAEPSGSVVPAIDPPPLVAEPSPNPFADCIFREPRQAPASVEGLNDHALRALLAQFERLAAGPSPRPRRLLDQALLVVSPQPGYGKSHLIGRLFAALAGRATLIDVTPFQSTSLCWQSILLRVIQEITFPERPADGASAPEPPTQLDVFAHGLFAHLIAALIETGRLPHPEPAEAAEYLRAGPFAALALRDPDSVWGNWLREAFEPCLSEMHTVLRRTDIRLHAAGWLRVLFRYAAALPAEEDSRALALAWLSGQSFDTADAAHLGLRAGELPMTELPDQLNELCWQRLLDFCALAAFYRPFVFCFDQTEAYGHQPGLARCFGTVIAQLHLAAPNQLLVVTANQQPWQETVAKHMETADKDRFVPLPLEGINRAQAEALVRLRGAQAGWAGSQVEEFLGNGWLEFIFPTERNRLGVRQFLQTCSTRWQRPPTSLREVVENKTPWSSPPPAPPPAPNLKPHFSSYRRALQSKSKRQQFNPDTFRWLVEQVGPRLPGVSVEPCASPRGHLAVAWVAPQGRVLFGFEGSNDGRRWRAILADAAAACQAVPPGGTTATATPTKALFFRTPELGTLPGPRWGAASEFLAARDTFLDIFVLTREEVISLYAARAFALDAAAGDVPYVEAEAALAFVCEELAPLCQRALAPLATAAPAQASLL